MNPGSDAAIKNGCICPVSDNGNGQGWGNGCFWVYTDCPIHGCKLTADDFRDAYQVTDDTADCCDMEKLG